MFAYLKENNMPASLLIRNICHTLSSYQLVFGSLQSSVVRPTLYRVYCMSEGKISVSQINLS